MASKLSRLQPPLLAGFVSQASVWSNTYIYAECVFTDFEENLLVRRHEHMNAHRRSSKEQDPLKISIVNICCLVSKLLLIITITGLRSWF